MPVQDSLSVKGDPLSNLLHSLKLPRDNLSRSIVSFTRFFSLPLNGKLLGFFRKEVLGQQFREAAALGTAAAAGKGLEIRGKALGEYAAAIEGSPDARNGELFVAEPPAEPAEKRPEPPFQKISGNGEEGGGSGGGTDTSSGAPSGGGNSGHAPDRQDNPETKAGGADQNKPENKPPDPEALRRRVTAVLEEKPLLDLINRIPGKNGRRWTVLPFSFTREGVEFSVTLRVLLNINPLASTITGPAGFERLAADIKLSPGPASRERQWRIVLERSEKAYTRAEVSLFMGEKALTFLPAEQKRLETELADSFGLPRGKVVFGKEASRFADSRDDLLRPVNEAV
ncbi:MAG: hypothetical protein LBK77_00060 [Spirochaetaceae bacterium]|jgi:hypothetical protein|nr:hypothetical protein [Spirochaetaceae bacterium]